MNAISLARVSVYSFNDEIAVSLVRSLYDSLLDKHRQGIGEI